MRLTKAVAAAAIASLLAVSTVGATEVRLSDEQLDQVTAGSSWSSPVTGTLFLAKVLVARALWNAYSFGWSFIPHHRNNTNFD